MLLNKKKLKQIKKKKLVYIKYTTLFSNENKKTQKRNKNKNV